VLAHAVEMSTHGLSYVHVLSFQAFSIHIRQISPAHVATITCFNMHAKNASEGGEVQGFGPITCYTSVMLAWGCKKLCETDAF